MTKIALITLSLMSALAVTACGTGKTGSAAYSGSGATAPAITPTPQVGNGPVGAAQ